MGIVLFADESGMLSKEKCYTIGVLSVPEDELASFNNLVAASLRNHGVVGEAKWNKVSKSYGLINFGLDMLRRILNSSYRFNAVVVHKGKYRNWSIDRERAFYQTYTYLLKHCAVKSSEELKVHLDDRSDSYAKQHEVVSIIVNHMLYNTASKGEISTVTKSDSKQHPGIQVADMLAGAINAAHHRHLDPSLQMSKGKRVFIDRMAQMLGWDDVVYDTYPNNDFNIWHFPIEYRAKPATKMVMPNSSVPFISPAELVD